MARSTLKKARLLAGMTQIQIAEAVGVSQPTYQRWETGTAKPPVNKLAKLAKILKVTADHLLGKPEPFDLLGIDRTIDDSRRYFGEVAIHFVSGSDPLLLPLSEEARSELYQDLATEKGFVRIRTLDNRMVFFRRNAVADLYLSSEAYDDYGPGSYEHHLGVYPDDNFWKIVEHFECLELLEDEFDQGSIDDAVSKFSMSDEDLDGLVADGHVELHEREKVRKEADETTERFLDRARSVTWQLPSNIRRCEHIDDSKYLYEIFNQYFFDGEDEHEFLYLAPEGYHRSIFLNLTALDYISIPAHKYQEGQIESAEEEMGETE